MATTNAIVCSGSLGFQNLPLFVLPGISFTNLQFNIASTNPNIVMGELTVSTSATAVPLGTLSGSNLGMAFFRNLDPTNYITLFNGSGNSSAALAQLYGAANGADVYGGFAWLWLPPACVPYALASTANCQMQYLLCAA
jgi:hypothetical protein